MQSYLFPRRFFDRLRQTRQDEQGIQLVNFEGVGERGEVKAFTDTGFQADLKGV